MLDSVTRRLGDQDRRNASLSDTARFVLTAASVLVSGFAGLPASNGNIRSHGTSVQVVISLFIYAYLVFCCAMGFRLRTFDEVPKPRGLVGFLHQDTDVTKLTLTATMIASYEKNALELERKTCWVSRAQGALVAEAVWLAALAVWTGAR